MRITKYFGVLLIGVVCLLGALTETAFCLGQCTAPSTEQQSSLTVYVSHKFHVPKEQIQITEVARANDACFYRLKFVDHIPKNRDRYVVLYLSPDHRYLAPDLLDTTVDPLVVELKEAAKVREKVEDNNAPYKGGSRAPVTVVEFSDFECPYCQRLSTTLEQLLDEHPELIRVEFRYFPLPMHPWSKTAALNAECAFEQSSTLFWKLHDYYFENQKTITPADLQVRSLAELNKSPYFDSDRFQKCVVDSATASKIKKDIDAGSALGVASTPTFYINGSLYNGAKSKEELESIISSAAAEQKSAGVNTIAEHSSAVSAELHGSTR